RDGLIHNMLELIHTHWKRRRCVKVKCKGVPTVDMDNVCHVVEDKTGGRIIKRQGGTLYVFRGRNYNYRLRPRLPLMLWKPPAPIYPKLIQDAPGGLTLRQAQELRRIGRKIKPLCKLGKNGVYHRLVGLVRAGFEEADLVRVDCKGMNKSDYKKIGAKLRDLVPCVLLSFDKEQILMWRGLDSQEPSPEASPEVTSETSTVAQAESAIAGSVADGGGNNPAGEIAGGFVGGGKVGMGAGMEGGEEGKWEGVWKFDVEDEGEVEVSLSVDADGMMVVGGEEGEEEGGEEIGGGVDGDDWEDEERWGEEGGSRDGSSRDGGSGSEGDWHESDTDIGSEAAFDEFEELWEKATRTGEITPLDGVNPPRVADSRSATMGRKLWCLFVIALLICASIHSADAKKKKKVVVEEEEAADEGTAAAEPSDEGDADEKTTSKASKAEAEVSEDEDAEPPAKPLKSSKKASKLKKAAEEDEGEEKEEAAADADEADAPAPKKVKSAKKASDDEEEDADAAPVAKKKAGADDEESSAETEDEEEAPAAKKKPAAKKRAAAAEEEAGEDEAAEEEDKPSKAAVAKAASAKETDSGEDEEAESEKVTATTADEDKPKAAKGGVTAVSKEPPMESAKVPATAWKSKNQTRDDIDPQGACKRDIALHCQGIFETTQIILFYHDYVFCDSGACKRDITLHCQGITPGEAQLSLCLVFHIKNEKAGNEVATTACKADITKFCDDDFLYPEPGNIIACLREVKQVEKLQDACLAEVLRHQMEAADDFVMDPQLRELCSGEADRLCKGVEPGEGRVQNCLDACLAEVLRHHMEPADDFVMDPQLRELCSGEADRLCKGVEPGEGRVQNCDVGLWWCDCAVVQREHRTKLAWDCQAELFRQEVENADDIRLNVRLFQACLNDQRKFCADVKYGDARVKDCLEDHRLDDEFSPGCKTEFEKMMARRATDFRLDSRLRKYCKGDIAEICYPDAEDISDVANYDAKVIQCLQDYRDELKDPKCKAQVHKLTEREIDIRFNKPLADACESDRTTVCKDAPDGQASVFMCLQDHMPQLKEACRNSVFEQCLQDHIDDADFGEACRKEVQSDLVRSAQAVSALHSCIPTALHPPVTLSPNPPPSPDYRLNYRLHKACLPDIQQQCLHACDAASANGTATCGGMVLRCLQDNKAKLQSPSCTQEVDSFSVIQSKDPLSLDVPLQKACQGDLVKLCPDVSRDHARTLSCLRTKREKLSTSCREEEMRFSIMEVGPGWWGFLCSLRRCCSELQSLCRDAPPTEGQAFKCLQEHLQDVGMGAACKGEVNLQEARHASNYRLDVRVRKECEDDVTKFCNGVDAGQEGHALVLKCMVGSFKSLSASCQSEVSYAVRMALFQYHKGAALTQPCDTAVEELCNTGSAAAATTPVKEINGAVIGVYGQCLVSQKRQRLPEECRTLVKLVAKEGAYVGGTVDQNKLEETLMKLKAVRPLGAWDGMQCGGMGLNRGVMGTYVGGTVDPNKLEQTLMKLKAVRLRLFGAWGGM
ncbi:unnamed protein product, partial [Closterium sp. NIES-53]